MKMNKKITIITIITMLITTTTTVYAQDLPTLSTPKLAPLQSPTLSTSFQDLRTNINKDGNLPDLPKLQSLPELDTSEFGKMSSDFTKGTGELTKEGLGKKIALTNPTLSASNKGSLFADINNQYASAKANLPSASIPEDQIRSKLSNFDKTASSLYNSAITSNTTMVDGKVTTGQATINNGDLAFQKALQGQFSLDNFETPESSIPEWLYKPSSKITDRQEYIAEDTNTTKQKYTNESKIVQDGQTISDMTLGVYVPPATIQSLNPRAQAYLEQFNSIKSDTDSQTNKINQEFDQTKAKTQQTDYKINVSTNNNFIDTLTNQKANVQNGTATDNYLKMRSQDSLVLTALDVLQPSNPLSIVKNLLKLKNTF